MIKVIMMGEKLNVVDSHNNLVGFDTADDCCANGGYFISATKYDRGFGEAAQAGLSEVDFPGHVFDPDFFEVVDQIDKHEEGAVIFRMRPEYHYSDHDKTRPDLYLHLYNCHNGYYSKGFKAALGNVIKTGSV